MSTTSYSAMLNKAQVAGTSRDYATAENLLMRILAETDSLPEAWLYLGRARHALGRHDRAISAFAAYLGYRPEDAAGWFFLGRTYLAIGSAREAASCLRTAIDKGADNSETWALLGFAQLKLKRSAISVASLEHAVSLAPNDARIFRAYLNALYVHAIRTLARGNAHEAVGMLGFVIDNGLDGAAQHLYRARALHSQGFLDDAIAELEAAMRLSPGDSSILLQTAALRIAAGDVDRAIADIRKAGFNLPEHNGAPWTATAIERWRVMEALKAGDYRNALKAALDRIRSGESDAAIRAVAAQCNYELGHYEKAASHFRRAIEADPGSPELRIGLAQSLIELGDYSGAKSSARAATARGAQRDDAHYVEAICDIKLGADPSVMLPRIQTLLHSRPGDPRLMAALGECLYKTGFPDLADSWFENVLLVIPGHEMSLLYRISIAESLEDDTEAVVRYSAYLAAYPDNLSIRKNYVDVLVKQQKWDRAAAAIEEGYAYGAGRSSDVLLALCQRNAGHYREAAALYRGLLRAEPRRVDLLLGLAYSLFKSGSKNVAIELLERGAHYIGSQAEPYLALGTLRARRNEAEKAAAAFLKASELAPADPRPLRSLASLYRKAGVQETATLFENRAAALESGTSSRKKSKKS